MTTNITNIQAASIAEDYEFVNLAANYGMAWTHPKPEVEKHHLAKLASYIDAKLAQARVDASNLGLEAGRNEYRDFFKYWKNRAIAAESRLAEIQRGVEGLMRYEFRTGFKLDVPAAGMLTDVLGKYVMFEAVEALLQPQGQADTSGLPG